MRAAWQLVTKTPVVIRSKANKKIFHSSSCQLSVCVCVHVWRRACVCVVCVPGFVENEKQSGRCYNNLSVFLIHFDFMAVKGTVVCLCNTAMQLGTQD